MPSLKIEERESKITHLRRDAQHFEGWWHVESLLDLDVSEVDGKGLAPDSKVSQLMDGQVTG